MDFVRAHRQTMLLCLMSEHLIFEAAALLLDLLSTHSNDAILGGDLWAHKRIGIVLCSRHI